MTQTTFFKSLTGDNLKAIGQQSVLRNSHAAWRMQVEQAILDVCKRFNKFTFDDIREEAYNRNIMKPHHENCWGSIIKYAAKNGWAKRTGEYRKSTNPSSHSRMLAVWQSKIYIGI